MIRRKQQPDVVYVERGGDSSAKWLFWGACLGAGLALLYAPRTGEETRRNLQRRLWKLRAMSEEKLDDLMQSIGGKARELRGQGDDEPDGDDLFDDESYGEPSPANGAPAAVPTAREELELRLEKARARRRRPSDDYEEPLA